MEDISKRNKKEKTPLFLKLLGILPFLICGAFIYLWCTTEKTLWEGKIFFIGASILFGMISAALLLLVILHPFYAKMERELEQFGRPEKAKIVKVKLLHYNFVSPRHDDRDKFEYNHEELCGVGTYNIVLEFVNRDGKKIRRTQYETLTAPEVTALVKKGELDVKVYKNNCKLIEEIPAATFDKDILPLNSNEVKITTGINLLSAKANLFVYCFAAIVVALLFVFLTALPFFLYQKYLLSTVFILFIPAVAFLTFSVLLAFKVYENVIVGASDYRVKVYGFSLLAKYKGKSKTSIGAEHDYVFYVAFTVNGKTYDKLIDARTFSRLQVVQRVDIGFDVFVKGKKTLIDIDSLPIF